MSWNADGQQKRMSSIITEELESVVDAFLSRNSSDKIDGEKTFYMRSKTSSSMSDGEIKTLIVGLALKIPQKEITERINDIRIKNGLNPLETYVNFAYYRHKFGEIIDEIYTLAFIRIGEIYPLADKMIRISRYNELAEALRENMLGDFKAKVIVDEMTLKMGNLYVKILSNLNQEMGARSYADMVKRVIPPEDDEKDKLPISVDEVKELLKAELEDRYKGQLPESVSRKVEFSDYTNCANGEMMSGVCACFNDKMTDDKPGSQCKIQAGELKICPKFLNKSLLNNREWLIKARTESMLSIRQLAELLGCTQYDSDVRMKVGYYLKKYEIFGISYTNVLKRREKAETQEDITDEELMKEDGEIEEQNADTTRVVESGKPSLLEFISSSSSKSKSTN